MKAIGRFICRTCCICVALSLLSACRLQDRNEAVLFREAVHNNTQWKIKEGFFLKADYMKVTGIIEEVLEFADILEEAEFSTEEEPGIIKIGFAGDFNLDENWATTRYLNEKENGIYDCIDPDLIEELNRLDIFMLNNEFTYSDRGTPMVNKLYTFRADKNRVDIIKQLGTDIVLLANNHVFDYGEDAFLDTLQVLSDAEIQYVGVGKNLEEACRPCYFDFDGIKIAFVAATKAEKNILTPQAGEESPGVLRCYDPELFLRVITEAADCADYVIASIHFGTEYECMADDAQRELAYQMIDAGADAVIGSHAHVLQGMEFYQDKPIVYNLGNFWFNDKDLYSCIIELHLQINTIGLEKEVSLETMYFLPCTQYDCYTDWILAGEGRDEILKYEESISFGISIDENGIVRRKAE